MTNDTMANDCSSRSKHKRFRSFHYGSSRRFWGLTVSLSMKSPLNDSFDLLCYKPPSPILALFAVIFILSDLSEEIDFDECPIPFLLVTANVRAQNTMFKKEVLTLFYGS